MSNNATTTDRVTNIAIVGYKGQIGSHIVASLLKTGRHKVTALTRLTDTTTSSSSSTTPSPSPTFEVGIKWILPNEWGSEYLDEGYNRDVMFAKEIVANRRLIETKADMKWIAVCPGFWYESSLGFGPRAFGFDLRDKSVVLYDGGNTLITTSTWERVGEAVARLLSLPLEAEDGPTLSDFANSFLRISSFTLSQRDMLASLCRVTETTEADWTITSTSSGERLRQGREEFATGDRNIGFSKILYARTFLPDPEKEGRCLGFIEGARLHNGILGLKEGGLDEATRRAVKVAQTKQEAGEYA